MSENDTEKPARQKRTTGATPDKPKRVKKGRDPEGMAIGIVATALEGLEPGARARVMRYVAERLEVSL